MAIRDDNFRWVVGGEGDECFVSRRMFILINISFVLTNVLTKKKKPPHSCIAVK